MSWVSPPLQVLPDRHNLPERQGSYSFHPLRNNSGLPWVARCRSQRILQQDTRCILVPNGKEPPRLKERARVKPEEPEVPLMKLQRLFTVVLAGWAAYSTGCHYCGPRPFARPFTRPLFTAPVSAPAPIYSGAPVVTPQPVVPGYPLGYHAEGMFPGSLTSLPGPSCSGCLTSQGTIGTGPVQDLPGYPMMAPHTAVPSGLTQGYPVVPQSVPHSYENMPMPTPNLIPPGSEKLGQPTVMPPGTGPKVEILPQPMPKGKS